LALSLKFQVFSYGDLIMSGKVYTPRRARAGAAAIVLLMCVVSQARIKLAALPERAAAVIRLDNPQATLIEEEDRKSVV
jgi:hypothetical protein